MSDGRFQVVEHNGIPCLRVMIDTDDEMPIAQTHIPLDDIEAAVAHRYAHKFVQELAQKILDLIERTEQGIGQDFQTFGPDDIDGRINQGIIRYAMLKTNIKGLCKEQLEKEGETNHG